jgi:CBS domain-containing protein
MKRVTMHETFSSNAPVITVGLDTPARDALRQMRQHSIHHLVVSSPEGVLGVISDRQLLGKALTEDGVWKDQVTVRDGYVRLDETLTDESDLAAAMDLMAQTATTALPMVKAGRLIGIVTESDLMRILRRHVGSTEISPEEKGQLVLGNPLIMNLMQLLAEAGI